MVERIPFGSSWLLRITDALGQSVDILPLGATVRAIRVLDRRGTPVDVALGYDTPEEYRKNPDYLGAVVGRVGNRIAGARFTLNGADYVLDANDGPNSLHGGFQGYDKRMWALEPVGEDGVCCRLHSPDGDQGYPGGLDIRVTYTFRDGALTVAYAVTADADTIVSLTNHTYFNLAGEGDILDHRMELNAPAVTAVGPGLIPTGALRDVTGTVWDLRQSTRLGDVMDHPDLAASHGFDHNYVWGGGVRVTCPATGITMEVDTDLPGVQFYAGGCLAPKAGKAGAAYGPFSGFCLETQFYPDAIHHPAFPSCLLRGGETWRSATTYRFSAR